LAIAPTSQPTASAARAAVWTASGSTTTRPVPPAWTKASRKERIEGWGPLPAEPVDPLIDLLQGLGPDGVEAPGALGPDRREAGLSQDPQVLGDRGLGDAELLLDGRADAPGALLAVGQQLQEPAPYRITEDVEGVHSHHYIGNDLYKSRPMNQCGLRGSGGTPSGASSPRLP